MNSKKITMNNLKIIRKNRNITQVKLSFLGNVSQSSIVAYETGTKLPSVETLVQLADSLGTSTDYLLDRTNNSNPFIELNELQKNKHSDLISAYDSLVDMNKEKALSYIFWLLASQKND